MSKKHILAGLAALILPFCGLNAQQTAAISGTLTGEIEHAGIETEVDSTLFGKDIFSALPEDFVVRQPSSVRRALNAYTNANDQKTFSGFRIRIYLESGKEARGDSDAVIRKFNSLYPHIQAYRTYDSPNFKVTVGNFRTRLDAERLLRIIKPDFPNAFIVRDKFKYPGIGQADTSPLDEDEAAGLQTVSE